MQELFPKKLQSPFAKNSNANLLYVYSRVNFGVLAIRLKPELEERLAKLAQKTGRTKTFYAREAIEQHLDDLEDYYLAADAAKNPGRIYSSVEIENELGLSD